MSAALLSKRLDRALDAAQYFTKVFPDQSEDAISASGEGVKTVTVDFTNLPTWTGKIGLNIGRQSMKEGLGLEDIERKERERMTGKIEPPPNLDPFFMLRNLFLALGEEVDGGFKEMMFEDAEESSHALFIKVVEVRKVDDITPLLVIQFRLDAKPPEDDYAFWNYASTTRLGCRQFSTQTLILLHRLLLLNSERVATGGSGYRSANLKSSFIIPVGPIGIYDMAQLTRDLSCAVCGKQSRTRCSRCQTTAYCSRGCQTEDWTTHKKTCNSLTGAKWSVMPFSSASPIKLKYSTTMSLNGGDPSNNPTKPLKPAKDGEVEVPPNGHGDNPFLIKVQHNLNGSPQLTVYDRTRALETHFIRNDNPKLFDQIAALVREKGFMGMKIYVWAKRTADFELSLALDNIPNQNVPW